MKIPIILCHTINPHICEPVYNSTYHIERDPGGHAQEEQTNDHVETVDWVPSLLQYGDRIHGQKYGHSSINHDSKTKTCE